MEKVSASDCLRNLHHPDESGVKYGISTYLKQRRRFFTDDGWDKMLAKIRTSSTMYVGGLSFHTTEEQIHALFSRIAPVKRIIMGLNKLAKTPCGFCFVVYHTHEDAMACKKFISGTMVDDKVISADIDPGFEEGRQYGRSKKSGGQVRNDRTPRNLRAPGGYSRGHHMNNNNNNNNRNKRNDYERDYDKDDRRDRKRRRRESGGDRY